MQTADQPPRPAGTDPARAALARVYDLFLGGTDAYAIEHDLGQQLRAIAPDIDQIFTDERDFLIRACHYLTEHAQISRFLISWAGFPHRETLHDVILRANPDATISYIAHDPLILATLRAEMDTVTGAHVINADIFTPPTVLTHPHITRTLADDTPVCWVLLGIWSHIDDAYGDPAAIVREYVRAAPTGSYVVSSWLTNPTPGSGSTAQRIVDTMRHSALGSGRTFTPTEIATATDELDIVPADLTDDAPGPVPCFLWWQNGPHTECRTTPHDSGRLNVAVVALVARTTPRQATQ
ncbi:SAM-dependent methyltransferase [Amycolatopsis sp. H20-H5]|uniref:SAM-dependent methyltransferase n=1 Tax=Amycolatopsis sp. H20-H5 TaxID=3046309 RepID=UPI002DBA5AD7|nr:SAM-dependent methyltransferase [Amycolatopsis sp. H20-H5]MEC3980863.1 SAM-dependent methyltransferase [Amycolatopsis sp. H20-H5]